MYRTRILEQLAKLGRIGVDPAHVEGWMRLEHSTLDGLSREAFAREALIAVECIDQSATRANDELAQSYGLKLARVAS